MTTLEIIIGVILIILAVALVVLISLQQSKRHGLGNSIAGQGASESYLSRNKIASNEMKLQRATIIVACVFVAIVLALFIIHNASSDADSTTSQTESTAESAAESETEPEVESSEVVESSEEPAPDSEEAAE